MVKNTARSYLVGQRYELDIKKRPRKYGTYINGYKIEKGKKKPIQAFVFEINGEPIGYIQLYNAYNFKRSVPLINLPSSLAAFDMYIGEEKFLKKGIGSKALNYFLETYCDNTFEAAFADPDSRNIAAIKTYENTGFKIIKELPETHEIWMLRYSHDH